MLVHQSDLFISPVMQRIFVEYSVEGADVVVVGITQREPAASDIDVVHFFLVGAVEDRGSVRSERGVRP